MTLGNLQSVDVKEEKTLYVTWEELDQVQQKAMELNCGTISEAEYIDFVSDVILRFDKETLLKYRWNVVAQHEVKKRTSISEEVDL